MEEIWKRKGRSGDGCYFGLSPHIQKLRLVVGQRWPVNDETWKATVGEISTSTAARRSG